MLSDLKDRKIAVLSGVGLRYDRRPEVLRDLSFSLEAGSFHFLTGLSGAGKSSLLSLLYLSQRPTRGNMSLFGLNVVRATRAQLAQARSHIGVVFQDFRLIGDLNAVDNVAVPLFIAGANKDRARKYAKELMEWVGLKDHVNSPIATLSGGQQQRIAIARAVINRPHLLLADEPTGNVDDTTATRIMTMFTELNKAGTTVVIATHNDRLISRFAFPRLHLVEGKLQPFSVQGIFNTGFEL